MILDATNKKLQIVLGEATVTTACDITTAAVDTDSGSTFVPVSKNLVSNGTTPVDVVDAPAAGTTQRQVREVILYNNDTISHVVKLLYKNNATTYVVKQETIAPLGQFKYVPEAVKGDAGPTGAQGTAGTSGAGYDLIMSASGTRDDGEKLLIYVADTGFTLPANLPNSVFYIGTAPGATAVFNLFKNGSNIGNLSVSTSNVVTLTFNSDQTFGIGDVFVVTAPSPNDGTMADIAFSFRTLGATGTTNAQYGSLENRFINGDFNIDQRNEFASVTPAASGYVCDGFKAVITQASKLTFQVVADGPGSASQNSLKVTTAVALTAASTDESALEQDIEGIYLTDDYFGTANAKTLFVSFWIKASAAGNYGFGLGNSANNRSWTTTFTVNTASIWQYVTIAIPGDVAGTWLSGENQVGLRVMWDLGAGSNFRSTTVGWTTARHYATTAASVRLVATLGATFQITNARLRVGANFDIPYIPRAFADELFLCQRYYFKTFKRGVKPAQNAGVSGAVTVRNPIAAGEPSMWVPFPCTMSSAAPTIVTYNPSAANANWRDITATADVTVSVDPATTIGPDGVFLTTSGTVTTLGDILAIHLTADCGL